MHACAHPSWSGFDYVFNKPSYFSRITLYAEHVSSKSYSSSTVFSLHTLHIFKHWWWCHGASSTPNLCEKEKAYCIYFFLLEGVKKNLFLIFPLLLYILIAYGLKKPEFSSFKEQDSSFGGLEKCITLLKGSNDEQRLVGLLLATKYVQGNDKDSVRKIFNAVGAQFINRLLKSG